MTNGGRVSRDEIFQKLEEQLGPESAKVVSEVVAQLQAGKTEQGLSALYVLDCQIGGVGIYKQHSHKLPGVYRPLTYVDMVLQNTQREQLTRLAVHASCAHLESLLKTGARLGIFDQLRADKLPLGALVSKIKTQLPPFIYDNLVWLSKGIYNPAKHDFDFFNEDPIELESRDEHLFDLEETIAIYLLVRKLAIDLIDSLGLTSNALENYHT